MLSLTFLLAGGLLGSSQVSAQDATASNRIEIPGSSTALDDGAPSVTTNPALFGFDPDPGASLLYRSSLLDPNVSFQAGTTAGGVGMGVYYTGTPDQGSFWALSTNLALRFSDDLVMGTTVRWNIPQGSDNNFTSWDLGLGWRPLYWLGFGGAARNIGNPSPEWGASGSYGLGVALRPLGDTLSLAYDYSFLDPYEVAEQEGSTGYHRNQVSLRSEPLRGLVLRVYATDEVSFGGGLELYFGKSGIGVYGAGNPALDSPSVTAGVLTTAPERRLFGGGKRVPEFKIAGEYPYTPRASFFAPRPEGYLQLLRRLNECASDPTVKGVLVHLDETPFNLAQVEEIRGIIGRIKDSGRPVVVYLDQDVGNAGYYLATSASQVLLHPASTLDLVGLSMEMEYLRGTMDMIGIEAQYASRSEYKSAIEPMTRTSPSPASVEQSNALLDDLHGALVKAVAQGRGRSEQEAQALLDGGPWTAREAKEKGLVDALAYPDELKKVLEGTFPKGFQVDERYRLNEGTPSWTSPKRIAVVVVAGTITSGQSEGPGLFGGSETAGSETVVKALEQAAEDRTVRAVVLRVDSPGGSAFASEEIWRAVELVKEKKKPVVVSMGGYAASGGYYVASGADAIYAQPSTITGSIGVFGGKINVEGLFDKLGVETVSFSRGRKAGMWSMSRPFDPTELQALDHLIGETYDQFKQRVGEGRALPPEKVEELARGRVWSGAAASQNGLVNEQGGFHDALERARQAAGMSKRARFDLITYQPSPDFLGNLPTELVRTAVQPVQVPSSIRMLHRWRQLEDERLWMVMPYELEIQ